MTTSPDSGAYTALEARFKHLHALRGASAMLDWDSQTMMPVGGAAARADQQAALALVCHETLTDTSPRASLPWVTERVE